MPIFFTSKSDDCYDSGIVTAIRRIAALAQNYVNRTGGFGGRQLIVNLLDDKRDPNLAAANLASAIADPQTIAMAGFRERHTRQSRFRCRWQGPEGEQHSLPLGHYSRQNHRRLSICIHDPSSEDEERMPVINEFIKEMKFARVAFVGLQDNVASTNLEIP